MNFPKIEGLIPATLTPFNEDCSINYGILKEYADFLYKNGIKCVFLNGSTGETFSLSLEERIKLVEEWMKIKPDGMKVIIHVTDLCLDNAIKMAKHAQNVGADGISTMGCFYFRAPSVEDLVDNCAKIAAAAPKLPYYYYHIPSLNAVKIDMIKYMHVALEKIPTFAGIKYTHRNLGEYNNCCQIAREQEEKNNRPITMFSGKDEFFIPYVSFGARGAVGSTYNVIAPIFHQIMDAFKANDMDAALHYQEDANDVIYGMIHAGGFFSALKTCLREIGIDMGPVRAPNKDLSEEQKSAFVYLLKNKTKFYDICSKK